jgi:hypothetical protein
VEQEQPPEAQQVQIQELREVVVAQGAVEVVISLAALLEAL